MALIDRIQKHASIEKDEQYYVLIESHLDYFRKNEKTQLIEITGLEGEKFTGDFYGLLNHLRLGKNQYLVMRLNGLTRSSDYDGKLLQLLIPGENEVAKVISTYRSIEER